MHGTSTGLGDLAETKAIKSVFGASGQEVDPLSRAPRASSATCSEPPAAWSWSPAAWRSATVCLPPTINLDNPDPECDLDYIPNVAREVSVDHVMSNSFGFGGHNASLLIGRYPSIRKD